MEDEASSLPELTLWPVLGTGRPVEEGEAWEGAGRLLPREEYNDDDKPPRLILNTGLEGAAPSSDPDWGALEKECTFAADAL